MAFSLLPQLSQLKHKSIIGQMVVIALGMELLFFSSFTALNLPTATGGNLLAWTHNEAKNVLPALPNRLQEKILDRLPDLQNPSKDVRFSFYVVTTPVVVFLGYILGELLAPVSTLMFVALGFIGPALGIYTLANGGGLNYYQQPGFGYLLGMIIASFWAGKLTSKRRTSLGQILAIAAGLVCVHLTGLIYMLGSCLASTFLDSTHAPVVWQQWLFEEARNLTWYQLPYDLLLALMLMGLGFPFRWLVKVLTAPDITLRPRIPAQLEEFL